MAAAQQNVGGLKIYDWHEGNSSNRALRVAELHDTRPGCHPTLLPKLFDATVVKVTFSGMLIVGYEMSTLDGVLTEFKQGWWAKAV